MLRHSPSDPGAVDRLPSVAPADGASIAAAVARGWRVTAAIGLSRLSVAR
jgi:hypothetical protein